VQELDLEDQIRNVSELAVIVAATFIGKFSLLKFLNQLILPFCRN
jgi:hypothetical protein